jgi:putative SOS response-associated peptidase YedK
MCYSARVKQHLRNLERRFGAEVDWALFEALFSARMQDSSIKIARALEANFDEPQSDSQQRIKAHIEAFRTAQEQAWQEELFKQKKRLADAERVLKVKETKKALSDVRIATEKSEKLLKRLANLRRIDPVPTDSQIFPMYYAPVILEEDGKRLIRPMRYTCRLAGKPANYDERYPGTYNARRDNLQGFWSSVYGTHHGLMVVNSFFENVPNHLFEKRELAPGEKARNIVLEFNPQPPVDMLVACLWSHWTGTGEPDLYSFAAVTDEPPPEIAATGHNRCIIAIKDENVDQWLAPAGLAKDRLEAILSDKQRPFYEHRIAA